MKIKTTITIILCVVFCCAILFGCTPKTEEAEEPVAEVTTEDTAPQETTEPAEPAEESGIIEYIAAPEDAEVPYGYTEVTEADNAVIASQDYPVYQAVGESGYVRYVVYGSDESWHPYIARYAYTYDSETEDLVRTRQFIFKDSADIDSLPEDAVPAPENLIPQGLGFSIYAVKLSGDEIDEYRFYAYADVYDCETGELLKSGWKQIDVVDEYVAEADFSYIIDGQKVWFVDPIGNVDTEFTIGLEDPYYLPFEDHDCFVLTIDINDDEMIDNEGNSIRAALLYSIIDNTTMIPIEADSVEDQDIDAAEEVLDEESSAAEQLDSQDKKSDSSSSSKSRSDSKSSASGSDSGKISSKGTSASATTGNNKPAAASNDNSSKGHWETKKVWVVDKAAYDEEVEELVGDGYECPKCGKVFDYDSIWDHIDQEGISNFREHLTTKTTKVHHDEVGHWEEQQIWVED